ncbi:MAG: PHA/PHB synthase family protein [Caulobacterales bacterium]
MPFETDAGERAEASAPDEAPIDRHLHAAAARLTGGLSLVGLAGAWQDWALHLAASPGLCMGLAQDAWAGAFRLATRPTEIETAQDPRFRGPGWQAQPFNAYAAGFQAVEQWWRKATTGVHGVTGQHERVASFAARQMLDMVSPSNFVATNPDVLARAVATGGGSLVQGAANLAADVVTPGRDAGDFQVGRDVAVTPGEVVARTPLAEIIQYRPSTATVRPEPVVIVPAWIMKYYILDLTPAESLVRALVADGFTVFMVSWKNPGPEDRDRDFDDYRRLGALAAIDAACEITGSKRVHAAGYCLGGTLLAMTAAAMARDGDERLASLTLLASQADFTEAGELTLFVNEAQVALLEDLMWDRGYLRPEQMAGTFQVLRANDLIWSRMIGEYLMGDPRRARALDAWSADATRLPFRMESQNLRSLYLDNELAEGRFRVGGHPVALRDIAAPMFVLGTEFDHIAPWRSVYKLLLLCEAPITFVLTDRGHNVGVVCPPGVGERHQRVRRQSASEPYVDPDAWLASTPPRPGSWWPTWFAWLHERSGPMAPPPPMGDADNGFASLGPAPGRYVLEK